MDYERIVPSPLWVDHRVPGVDEPCSIGLQRHGCYLSASHDLIQPWERPIGYPLIIRALTWQSTLWTVIFFQGMLGSWLIMKTIRTLFPAGPLKWQGHVIILAFLLVVGSLPWYAAQLMPDVFSAYLGLCVFLIFFGRSQGRLERSALWILLFFIAITHYSHFLMLIVLGAFGLVMLWKLPWFRRRFRVSVAGLFAVPAAGILFCMAYNAGQGSGFVLSPASSLFLAGKFIESGVMHSYLKRRCPEESNFLCDHMDELNTSGMYYVWTESACTRQGLDILQAIERLEPIVDGILSDPVMWPELAWSSLLATLFQFAQVDPGSGLMAYGVDSPPWWVIKNHYPHELPMYMDSRQQHDAWALTFSKPLGKLVLLASCVVIVVLWPSKRHLRWWGMVTVLTLTTWANAAATGAVANIYDRLQARVTWLLVFAALMVLVHRFPALRRALFLEKDQPS
jgi:hypothetical protein